MGKKRFIELSEKGCSGVFRSINCHNKLGMLKGVLEETNEEWTAERKLNRAIADVASSLALIEVTDSLLDDDPGLMHQADQFEAMAADADKQAETICKILCPGKKIFSSLCQAELVFVDNQGNIEEVC